MAVQARELDLLQPRRWLDALTLALLWLGAGGLLLGAMNVGLALVGLHGVVVGAVLRTALTRHNYGAARARGRVRVGPDAIEVGDRTIPRDGIAAGFFQPRAPTSVSGLGSTVRLLDRHRRILLEAAMPAEEAAAFLRELGLDAGKRRVDFPIASSAHAIGLRTLAVLTALVALIPTLRAVLGLAIPFGIAFTLIVALQPLVAAMHASSVVVGVDGIAIRRLFSRRFMRMAEIASVERRVDGEIVLRLESGEQELLPTRSGARTSDEVRLAGDALHARIVEAWQARREAAVAPDVVALLGRNARSDREWASALQALEADAGYRQRAMRDEDLWRVIEDPAAPEDARAGAALLLRRTFEGEARTRVRVVAEAVASPRLRVALDAVLAGSEEAAQDALFAVDPPRQRWSKAGG